MTPIAAPNLLHSDSPIRDFEEDRLGRRRFATAIGRLLAGGGQADSLVIGLFGEWGLGKTSLLNLSLKAASESDSPPIIVRFNPWYFADHENLIRQFFETLGTEIGIQGKGKSYERASQLLKTLSKGVESLDVFVPGYAKLASSILGFFGKRLSHKAAESNSLDSIKTQISKALSEKARRVVIVLDDIDRLSAHEMRTMFQLVRGLGDFSYTTYILALDDAVVARALEDVQRGDGAAYLEKIVNVPLRIPPIAPACLRDLVRDALNGFAKAYAQFDWSDEGRSVDLMNYLVKTCGTMRDLHRFENALLADAQALDGEVDGYDLLGVTALRVLDTSLYCAIRDNRDIFINTVSARFEPSRSDTLAKTIIAPLLQNRAELQELVIALFPRVRRVLGDNQSFDGLNDVNDVLYRRERRICDPDSFDAYF